MKVVIPEDIKPGSYVVSWRWDCEETAQVFTMSDEENYYKLVTELSYSQYDCTIVKKAHVKAFSLLLRFGRTVLMSIL